MKSRIAVVAFLAAVALVVTNAPASAQSTTARPQIAAGESLSIAAEVVSFDPATRKVVLRGPLGGDLVGVVAPEVKDVSVLKPGALASITYYAAIAASVRRKGDASRRPPPPTPPPAPNPACRRRRWRARALRTRSSRST